MINIDIKMPKSCSECEIRELPILDVANGDCLLKCPYVNKIFNAKDYLSERHPQCPLQETTPLSSEVETVQKAHNTIRTTLQPKEITDVEVRDMLEHKMNCIDGEISTIQGNLESEYHPTLNTPKMEQRIKYLKAECKGFNTIKQHILNMQEEIENREETEQSFMKWVNRLLAKFDKIKKDFDNLGNLKINDTFQLKDNIGYKRLKSKFKEDNKSLMKEPVTPIKGSIPKHRNRGGS